MAGTFSKANLPKRPGSYVNFTSSKTEPVIVNPLGVVAMPVTHTWGPVNTVTAVSSWSEFLSTFGLGGTDLTVASPTYTDAYAGVKQAFKGESYQGREGARQVLVYRMVPSANNTPASSNLQSAAAATMITLKAKYVGSYGNRLKVAVVANAAVSTKRDIIIYDNATSTEVERYTTAGTDHSVSYATDIPALVAAINNNSKYITATQVAATAAINTIAIGSAQAFSGGSDASVTATEYTAAMTAFEPYRFSLFCPANLDPASTGASIQASITTWAAGLNAKGKRFLTIFGGSAGETVATAVTRTGTINTNGVNDPNFINLGGGSWKDSELGVLSTAQLAPRIAGILADRADLTNITFARLTGLDVSSGAPTESEILNAIANGVVVIARDSNATSPLRLEKGVTTYTATTDPNRPYSIYSSPKYLRVMHGIEMEITEWAESNVIGRLAVTNNTRDYLIGQMQARLQARQDDARIQPGWTVGADSSPAPTSSDEFFALSYSLTFGRSLEQILNTITVG